MKLSTLFRTTSALLILPGFAFAASTTAPTGVSAGFWQMYNDWSTALNADLGALIILFGVIMSAVFAIFMQRFVTAGMTLLASMLIGYGEGIFSSSAGVTAGIEMVELETAPVVSAAVNLPLQF